MPTVYTMETRKRIAEEYAARHGTDVIEPRAFLAEVQRMGKRHPAYEWFTWNDKAAAHEHRVNQARRFLQGIKVRVNVTRTTSRGPFKVKIDAPAFYSELEDRPTGGGYRIAPSKTPDEYFEDLADEAVLMLRQWHRRFRSVLAVRDVPDSMIEDIVYLLQSKPSAGHSPSPTAPPPTPRPPAPPAPAE